MRAVHTLFLLALAAGPVLAQTTDQNAAQRTVDQREQLPNQEQAGDRQNQRVERIQVEDEGSRVNELRVGGQTQSITVQPKTGSMPEYEIQPGEGARTRPRNGAETNTAPRVWNVMKF
ncbi:hypothetical protein [Paracidovorax valerianellae]|uniref:DUF2782 domain-containing protein n=1 Tax=Paracidovorax valerianellae TaxID=187868 RepID=A0A1G6MEI4_9BURK|nr:hypothetical protein [Paracidovorax valerianellae]MDA8444038.1 hypothetical protein [Paracidovorax valerianellae]SDC53923.1 hypothetical protein SAMN05192589_102394 [Paracidovorax valerianellae]